MRRRAWALALSVCAAMAPVASASTAAPIAACGRSVTAPAPPLGAGICVPVRPGQPVSAKLGSASATCALGFFFRDVRGATYATTGPNCAPPFAFDPGTTTWARGKGPAALDGRNGARIGEFAFRTSTDDGLGVSLIRLDRWITFDPQVCHYGGPTGITGEIATAPVPVVMVGPEGDVVGEAGSVARPGLAHNGLDDSRSVLVLGQSMVESGMPVMTEDGEVVGLAEWYTIRAGGPALFAVGIAVTRPIVWLAEAQRALRTRLTLLTAPLL